MKYLFVILLFVSVNVNLSYGQTKENLIEINKTWAQFCEAFKTLDASILKTIHTKDLIRISGGNRIVSYENYMSNYEKSFARLKASEQTNRIELRFFERINNANTASERGIYKLTRNKGTDDEKSYYGQFHVIFKNSNGQWLIAMDYDSSEFNTIGADDFEKAHDINDLDKFLN
ncbi:MAG: nuclear transport factor 2 family protein [Winogradskyella sp.]|uniref:nuclear transport factor 2 family protein n=1 Tax=Winogradskyella sp. TaxID=1883156 RepID=UPI000F3CCD75|nr:nuclear transport factor 2 family protein [Winogradskyella sp.]RNC86858.1 MAG: nuclear transport factor 2 family protein [Winogradskyella sp.]